MNLPLPLLKIIEDIDRDLPKEERKIFSDAITQVAKGKNLATVHWKFLATELRALPDDLSEHIQALVDKVIAGMDRIAQGKEWYDAAKVAEDAFVLAATVTGASRAALNSAGYAADAADFASTATYGSACAAAGAASEAAAEVVCAYIAADVATYTEGRQRQGRRLLSLIENAKS